MSRPRCTYKMGPCPKARCYRPEGYSGSEDVNIDREEAEALRLKDIKDMDQTSAAISMGISQSSFQRILASARKKITDAIFKGKVIRIDGD